MQTTKLKLNKIAKIITGLPIQRYIDTENAIEQQIISNISLGNIDNDFEIEEEWISEDIKEQFYSKEHDILVKVQQQIFAKEITTETNAIIPNIYTIIRVKDTNKVNPTFLSHYINNPIVNYEILRQADSSRIIKINTSILKNLTVYLPNKEEQDIYAKAITTINKRIKIKKQSIRSDEELIDALLDNIIGDNYAD